MKVRMSIPYAASDPKNGFICDRKFTTQEYARMELTEYEDHKDGVDLMVGDYLGDNIAINNYKKRKINVKPQSFYYYDCDATIMDVDGQDVTTAYLDEVYRTAEKFILMVYLNPAQIEKDIDLGIDLNMWLKSSLKLWNAPALDDEEKLTHLPKKDFKIKILADNTNALLKDCKFLESKGSNTAFAILVDRIIFTKN